MSTHFQLQIWNGSEYINRTTGQPDELRAHYRDSEFILGYRIVDTLARDQEGRQLPMKPKANWRSRQSRPVTEIDRQAELAAEHFHKVRTRDLQDHMNPAIKTDIDVFPVKPSGRGQSADFRMQLAGRLTGNAPRSSALYPSDKAQRLALEAQLADHGFRFIEITNPEDYS